MRVVARQDGRAAGHEAPQDLGLGLGDLLDGLEVAQVHRLHRGDDATCGRTISASGVISPAWFMPISNTPYSVAAACAPASAARPSGCCRTSPTHASARRRSRHSRSISLVPVLPTLPVTATMRALAAGARGAADRPPARAADRRRAAARRSGLALRIAVRHERRRGAGLEGLRATNSWPSRSSFSATNTSPGCSVRVSIEKPVMGATGVPSACPCAAATSSSHCHSGSGMDRCLRKRRAHRLVVRERQHGRCRRSGRSRGPCRRSAARRRARAGATPARMASARSPISRAPGAPARISARMARGRLAPRIVVGDDDVVGVLGRDAPHDRPLALVAVAAAAEHADEPAGRERAQRLERG